MFLLMGLCFGLSAFGLLVGAVWAYFSQQRKVEDRITAVGTVVELTTRATARSSIICPVVEFTASSGEKIKFTSEFGSRPAGYKVGQSVNVRYDPVDTQKAEIESTMNLWAHATYSCIYGCYRLLPGRYFHRDLWLGCFVFLTLRLLFWKRFGVRV